MATVVHSLNHDGSVGAELSSDHIVRPTVHCSGTAGIQFVLAWAEVDSMVQRCERQQLGALGDAAVRVDRVLADALATLED